ncbi:Uncharacterized protein PPKH_0743 [Pseudomonas putida]|nr:Uncharacterized protein PPKH_0743 [Pseudomonas putida]
MVHRRGTFRFRYMFRYTVVASCYLEALFYWAKGARFDSCLRHHIQLHCIPLNALKAL